MVASSIYVLDLKGKPIICRDYRGDIPANAVDKFIALLQEYDDADQVPTPAFSHDGVNYVVYVDEELVLALSRKNSNVMAILLFLQKLAQELEEESIRDNFVVTYELFDEVMDFGYPQTTETKAAKPPTAVTSTVSWRPEGIKYRKNEVFLDVIESINLLANSNGTVVRSEILGAVKLRCYLSGMPELRLGLNDKVILENNGNTRKAVEMEDIKFHQCVRLNRFDTDRTISFIPPDGDFELMSYRLNAQVKPLIWCDCTVENFSGTRMEITVKAKSQFKRRSVANNVEIYIPVPNDADSPKFKTSIGNAVYAPEKNSLLWKIKQFPGGREFMMKAQFGLPTIKNGKFNCRIRIDDPDKRLPINIKFEIPYYTTSGIQVRYLKVVEKSGYQALPWVRYITQNGGK
ncbi:Clathrin adaptor, mu subunit domain-containing protein [Rozella allomycis CSF55]|uniref:Clathrin adaptor, mu subunit domain-containing protein n=1 Tax=Rozella allomycis (strain CSF55) TaxID=988480 RepID=A0A075AQA4_ROZAC|nr:Clathrin adaptor, mu subunit domain-containing protein [Rozella allomycis CSF55]|eukprot:EPZ30782.1 Clathrin adaptor, mu subunit domain-containing protein [Rozella allomycis CSF55]